jgi:hypothetical protein
MRNEDAMQVLADTRDCRHDNEPVELIEQHERCCALN